MSSWVAHGSSGSGLVAQHSHGQSKTVPAVAAHRGRLWCLWADFDGGLWYAVTEQDGEFGERRAFPHQNALPVITNLNGHLHAILALATGELVHYHFDDEQGVWNCLGPLDAAAGVVAHSTPALVAFHNKLFLAFLRDGQLYYVATAYSNTVAEPNGPWSPPALVAHADQRFDGIPALFVIDGHLHVLCGTAAASRDILGYRFDYVAATWEASADVSEGRAARGVSATSYGAGAYLGFVENGTSDESHAVYVASYVAGTWQPHEPVAGQSAADPPQIAILNGRIHCIFNANTATRDLRWYSRPILAYSLSGWMGGVPDATPLSAMTVPGTHDSCARSNIPFVRTQYLDISQQLALGLRFLDLRLRRHDDGQLFCYHGGIPINLPHGLSFAAVMGEVWAFLRGRDQRRPPTEAVLISINNDDTSEPEKARPEVFAGAVADAIAAAGPYPDGAPRWFTDAVTPALGDVRGRAVLLRRFRAAASPSVPDLGLDLSGWLDDNPDFVLDTATNVRIHLQDKWKYGTRIALEKLIESKQAFVQAMMAQASPADAPAHQGRDPAAAAGEWFINFCSAVGDPVEHGEIAEAKWIAVGAHSDWVGRWVEGMNVRTRDHLVERARQVGGAGAVGGARMRLGVVNLDYPELPEDNDLVARLIETNF